MSGFDQELDASGLNCPLPILHAKKKLKDVPAGEILEIDVAILRRFDRHDFPADHLRGRRVGAMCAHRDQADIAVAFAVCPMIAGNRQKARIFTLCTGIGLHRDRVIPRHIAQFGG